MKQYKLVMRETHVHIPVLVVSAQPGTPGFPVKCRWQKSVWCVQRKKCNEA